MQPVIRVTDLSKAYRIGMKYQSEKTFAGTLKKMFLQPAENLKKIRGLKNPQAAGDDSVIWALRHINLELCAGEVLGIIGKNGSGKSTLLKLLSRITYPTTGSIEMAGRASSLLEVGTGFNPELTGRENVFLNGTLLGMTRREVTQRFDEIVAFSGVEKFIDTPVKRYSSGMKVRLAFSVAAHLEPDILIVDEVLAVGDAEFQKKCIGKMQQVANDKGRTVLFVSHDMLAVQRLCNRALLLQEGNLITDGKPSVVIREYLSQNENHVASHLNIRNRKRQRGNGSFILTGAGLVDENKQALRYIASGMKVMLALEYEVSEKGPHPVVIALFKNYLGEIVFSCISRTAYDGTLAIEEKGFIFCTIPALPLAKGNYSIDVIFKYDMVVTDHLDFVLEFEVEKGDFYGTGRVEDTPDGIMYVYHQWSLE